MRTEQDENLSKLFDKAYSNQTRSDFSFSQSVAMARSQPLKKQSKTSIWIESWAMKVVVPSALAVSLMIFIVIRTNTYSRIDLEELKLVGSLGNSTKILRTTISNH